jgi:hypothetical protein
VDLSLRIEEDLERDFTRFDLQEDESLKINAKPDFFDDENDNYWFEQDEDSETETVKHCLFISYIFKFQCFVMYLLLYTISFSY